MTPSPLAQPPLSPLDGVQPLSDHALASVDQAGLRLADALRAFFDAVPTDDRSRRGYAAALKVDRNLCQRGLAGAGHATRGLDALGRAPGLDGLDILINAGARIRIDATRVTQLRTATTRLRQLIDTLGDGSRPELLRRIEATLESGHPAAESGDISRAARARMFREAAQLTRDQCVARSLIGVCSPLPDDPNRVRCAFVGAFLGYKARQGAMPLTIKQVWHGSPDRPTLAASLIEHLCSSPLPTLSLRHRAGQPVNIIDTQAADPRRGADVVVAYPQQISEHPALNPPEVGFHFTRIGPPMTRLVFDIYMHRDLATGAAVHASAHAYAGVATDPLDAWDTRLPTPLTIKLLEPELRGSASPHWSRHHDATRWLFNQLAADPSEHIGYRLEVEYPIWSADYVFWFDYRRVKIAGGAE